MYRGYEAAAQRLMLACAQNHKFRQYALDWILWSGLEGTGVEWRGVFVHIWEVEAAAPLAAQSIMPACARYLFRAGYVYMYQGVLGSCPNCCPAPHAFLHPVSPQTLHLSACIRCETAGAWGLKLAYTLDAGLGQNGLERMNLDCSLYLDGGVEVADPAAAQCFMLSCTQFLLRLCTSLPVSGG